MQQPMFQKLNKLPSRITAAILAVIILIVISLSVVYTLQSIIRQTTAINANSTHYTQSSLPFTPQPFPPLAKPLLQSLMPPQLPLPVPRHQPHTKPRLRIAIVIDDMGLNASRSARAVRLPAAVTLAFLPYAPRIAEQAQAAANKGHQILLHLPMEPMGEANPGSNALRVNMNDEQIRTNTLAGLNTFVGFAGVNNHMGSRFTTNHQGMAALGNVLAERGVFFLDSRTSISSIASDAMSRAGVPTISRDIFLDDPTVIHNVAGQLLRTEQIARERGHAVAIGHPHPETLSALEIWLPQARARGVVIVPVGELLASPHKAP